MRPSPGHARTRLGTLEAPPDLAEVVAPRGRLSSHWTRRVRRAVSDKSSRLLISGQSGLVGGAAHPVAVLALVDGRAVL